MYYQPMLCEYNIIHKMPHVFLYVFLGVKCINIIFMISTSYK
jgi:hypothetical protein